MEKDVILMHFLLGEFFKTMLNLSKNYEVWMFVKFFEWKFTSYTVMKMPLIFLIID